VDCKAKEGQQTKGDEMTLGDFMDVLGRLHKLTPAQRRAVAEVLAEPEEVQRSAEASEKAVNTAPMNRKAYGRDEDDDFTDAANDWPYMTPEKRALKVRMLAHRFGRTEKAIRFQIQERT
jgi:hypothetical protein